MPLHAQVDWISFTISCKPIGEGREDLQFQRVEHIMKNETGGWLNELLNGEDWQFGSGRAPYKVSARSAQKGCSIYYSASLTTVLFEFSGQGCEMLRQANYLEPVLWTFRERMTRLDVAVDCDEDVHPREFVDAGVSKVFSTRGEFYSETGQTIYIGSQKSERFARVYRYYPPHPRSHLLRVEHVLRRQYAKMFAQVICEASLAYAVQSLGKSFEWAHPLWKPEDVSATRLSAGRPERSMGGTEIWLIKQAAPAFRKLVQQGVIVDAEEWLRQFFLEQIDDNVQNLLL